uniref:Uncharacterized protein n=1 Tax=Triticum urartu TaxID=4572 RepID=A0A8R7QK30_TRIUA
MAILIITASIKVLQGLHTTSIVLGLLWLFQRPYTHINTQLLPRPKPSPIVSFRRARHWCLAILPKPWKSRCSASLVGISPYCRLHRNYIRQCSQGTSFKLLEQY